MKKATIEIKGTEPVVIGPVEDEPVLAGLVTAWMNSQKGSYDSSRPITAIRFEEVQK